MSQVNRTYSSRCFRPTLELLEVREVLTGYQPSAAEQLLLERLNDARANPPAYGVSIGLNLNSVAPSQPLAFDTRMVQAARLHSQDMNNRAFFSHTGSNGSNPGSRLTAAGYPWNTWGESIAAGFATPESALQGLIVDAGVPNLGHRRHLLAIDAGFKTHRQLGVGIVQNGTGPYRHYYTIDSGATADSRAFLTGTVFNDLNRNSKYDIGEGLAGVTLTVAGIGTFTTFDSGGYSIPLSPGTYNVTVSGGAFGSPATRSVTISTSNVRHQFIPSTQPTPGTLPLTEDFSDGIANHLQGTVGAWSVFNGRYHGSSVQGGDSVSTILLRDPLPSAVEIFATVQSIAATATRSSNSALIFDYVSPTNFKYALVAFGSGAMALGRRVSTGWIHDRHITGTGVVSGVDYAVRVQLEPGGRATLEANGRTLTHTFADSLTDGSLGLGGLNSTNQFDDLQIRQYSTGAVLPYAEDFSDGVADHVISRSGSWSVSGGRFAGSAAVGSDALATLRLRDPLPANVQFQALMRSDPITEGRKSNAVLVFDYQSPTDFKFAILAFGAGSISLGRRTAAGWINDATLTQVGIVSNVDYSVRLVLQSGGRATFEVNGRSLTHTFADSVTDGGLGLAAINARAWFDNLSVTALP